MPRFEIRYTGDYLNEKGEIGLGDIALDLYDDSPFIGHEFLRDQSPEPGDASYWDRLYSLEIAPRHVAEANGIVIFRPWVKASAFAEGADNLVMIGRAGVGIDKIDLDACTAADVAVFNVPDGLTHSTASAAFVLMLALAKRLPEQDRMVRTGRWDLQPEIMGTDLPGKRLGIVGLGATGRELARLTRPWNMEIIAYSRHADPAAVEALGIRLVPTLQELLATSDFVSLHNRLDARTRGMIGEAELRQLQPHAYFINVARGEMVDQRALARALRERWFAGAGLDVFEHEPLALDDPLVGLDNVILAPHWLPATKDAARLITASVARGMLRAARGLVPDNVVNLEVLDRPGFRRKLERFRANDTAA
jgi:phosphoglycerate dehydrogenase-like enzyme